MTPTTDPPPSLIPVQVPKAVLLLTVAEYAAGIRRGKWWRRRVAKQQRTTQAPPTTPPDPTL
jgi:hypothetical protein